MERVYTSGILGIYIVDFIWMQFLELAIYSLWKSGVYVLTNRISGMPSNGMLPSIWFYALERRDSRDDLL